jgi:iron complex transport system ATP-binding protein
MSHVAQDVSVRVGGATLLADVSVTLEPGEIVAVAGPNGAGKSTLLTVLAGDRRPQSGAVSLAGRPLGSWTRPQLARHRAVMSPSREVAFDYTVEEVALLGRLPWHGGDPGPDDRAIVRVLLDAADCGRLAERPFASLSTGERQRVQLVRALAQVVDDADEPRASDGLGVGRETETERYLLLDEPTSSLDPAHQHLAMGMLRTQARAGRGVLVVLHDLDLAAAYADRLVLLSHGRVAASGATSEVLRADILAAVFDIPMLVMPHPRLPHSVVIADPPSGP